MGGVGEDDEDEYSYRRTEHLRRKGCTRKWFRILQNRLIIGNGFWIQDKKRKGSLPLYQYFLENPLLLENLFIYHC